MEAWLLGVPVAVHSGCPVTRHHCVESGGGLYFGNTGDFAGVVNEFAEKPALGRSMGVAGLEYVKQKYSWDAVLARFDAVADKLGFLNDEASVENQVVAGQEL
jgi:glycosyltransferase involved in cell wall biosynthesis